MMHSNHYNSNIPRMLFANQQSQDKRSFSWNKKDRSYVRRKPIVVILVVFLVGMPYFIGSDISFILDFRDHVMGFFSSASASRHQVRHYEAWIGAQQREAQSLMEKRAKKRRDQLNMAENPNRLSDALYFTNDEELLKRHREKRRNVNSSRNRKTEHDQNNPVLTLKLGGTVDSARFWESADNSSNDQDANDNLFCGSFTKRVHPNGIDYAEHLA